MLNNDLLYFHVFLTELGIRYPRVHRLILNHPQGPRKNKIKNRQHHPTGSWHVLESLPKIGPRSCQLGHRGGVGRRQRIAVSTPNLTATVNLAATASPLPQGH
jgi:hypothetical protein